MNVPTVAKAGLPGFEADQWYGVVGPANMPADVVAKINASLKSPAILERLQNEGAQPMPSTPKVFADLINKDLARWRKVIIDSKMTL